MRVSSLLKKLSALAVTSAMAVSMIPSIIGTAPVVAEHITPYEKYGDIRVSGVDIVDANGTPIQLRGMSTFGLQWDDGSWILNGDAFDALAYDWNCDIVRLAMYVSEGGYHDNPQLLLDRVEQGIQLATARGMYVLVDWHILNGDTHNPASEYCMEAGENLPAFADIKAAHPDYRGPQLFFAYLSAKYGDQGNVLFETANEPNGNGGASSWTEVLLPYHQSVVDAIRENDADQNANIVICGTEQWSQLVDAPIGNPVQDDAGQIMYTMHFYAGTHDKPDQDPYIMAMVDNARANGLPVFCTEWGTSEATGDGGPYINYSERWLDFLAERNISWCSWSLAQKNEISAACLNTTPVHPTDHNGDGYPDWTMDELSITGNYVRAKIRGEEAPVYTASAISLDFESNGDFGTFATEGANDGANQNITISPVTIGDNTVAKVNGTLTGGVWNNRLAFQGLGTVYGIYSDLSFDVIVANEDAASANITIKPIIQSPATSWWGDKAPDAAVTGFEDMGNGYSVAHMTYNIENMITGPKDALGHIILLTDSNVQIYLDNIGFEKASNGDISTQARIPDEPGTFQGMPFDFEEGGRQGWKPDGDSTATDNYLEITTVEITEGNHAMVMPAHLDPTNNEWEGGVRMSSPQGIMSYAESIAVNTFMMDLYLEADAATTGSVAIAVNPIPNGDGYWYGLGDYVIDFAAGEAVPGTNLLHYEISMPLSADGAYPFSQNVAIRNIILAFHNQGSDYDGNIYYDNIRFEFVPEIEVAVALDGLYGAVLGRAADEAGAEWWLDRFEAGRVDYNTMAYYFLTSEEYTAMDKSDEEFLMDCYAAILMRQPDEAGFEYWLNALQVKHISRDRVARYISQSVEAASVAHKIG